VGIINKKLDCALLDAYGRPHDIRDDGILDTLLAINVERAFLHVTQLEPDRPRWA
jgi:hypothetical protein